MASMRPSRLCLAVGATACLVSNENTRFIKGWCLDVHGLAISKYVAGREKDVDFCRALTRHDMVSREILGQRLAALSLDSDLRTLVRARIDRDSGFPYFRQWAAGRLIRYCSGTVGHSADREQPVRTPPFIRLVQESTPGRTVRIMKSAKAHIPMEHGETLEQILRRAAGTLFPDQTRDPNPVTAHSKSSDGDTPLHIAALWGDRHAARVLLEAGALVDAKGDMSCTPLYYAVMEGHLQVAELLLQQGADPDAKSELNFSPRILAGQKGDKAMAALFRQHKKH
jgi:hypothetical protein